MTMTQDIEPVGPPFTTDPVRLVRRELFERFPELRPLLIEPMRARALFNVLLPLVAAGTRHTPEQCMDALLRKGYYVSLTPPETVDRSAEQEPGGKAASVDYDRPMRPDSQRARILGAFVSAPGDGYTAIEAARAAGISEKSCYWKRVSELLQAGYIERAQDSNGEPIRRDGDMPNRRREVYVVTPIGQARSASLEQ